MHVMSPVPKIQIWKRNYSCKSLQLLKHHMCEKLEIYVHHIDYSISLKKDPEQSEYSRTQNLKSINVKQWITAKGDFRVNTSIQ